jgi:hypothetical protein
VLDGSPDEAFDYNRIDVMDVNDIFVSPATSAGIMFGSRGAGGAIIINTKRGFVSEHVQNRNIQTMIPEGYQQPVEFYSPRYETSQARMNTKSDFRTTIHWIPDVIVGGDGVAEVNFYSADPATVYGIVIEGVDKEGRLIHSASEEISVEP